MDETHQGGRFGGVSTPPDDLGAITAAVAADRGRRDEARTAVDPVTPG